MITAITSRLTINAGLRWEVEMPRTVDGNKMNAFDPTAINPVSGTPGVVTFAGQNGVPTTSFDANYKNFGPRLGFAYNAPFGLVIRGGAGIFYGPNISNTITTSATLGYSDNVSYVTSQAETSYVFLLANGFPAYTRPPSTLPDSARSRSGRNRPPRLATSTGTGLLRSPTNTISTCRRRCHRDFVVESGFIGNVSHHLTANDLTTDQLLPSLFGPGNTQVLRPFPQFSNVTMVNPAVGNSTYYAGYFKAEKRFSKGFSFLAHYTFSKFIDDVASGDEFGDPGSYMNQYNRQLDKG